MAGEAWPEDLPEPLVSGYSFQWGDGRELTKMQQGPRRARLRYERTPTDFKASLALTLAQLATFKTYYSVTLAGGTKTAQLPISNEIGKVAVEVLILKVGRVTQLTPDLFKLPLDVEGV